MLHYATLCSDGVNVGIALCDEGDQFCEDRGCEIARGRLIDPSVGYREERMPNRKVYVSGEVRDVQEQIELEAFLFLCELNNCTPEEYMIRLRSEDTTSVATGDGLTSEDGSAVANGGWELRDVETNQGWEEGRDRSYLLVPLDDFVEHAGFSAVELKKIQKSKQKTWWDEGWDIGFKKTIGKKLDELGFCNDPGALGLMVMDMGHGPSFSYRLFKVHESFVSLDQKIGDLPQYEGEWFVTIYDREEGTTPYNRLCQMLCVQAIDRYNWSVFE